MDLRSQGQKPVQAVRTVHSQQEGSRFSGPNTVQDNGTLNAIGSIYAETVYVGGYGSPTRQAVYPIFSMPYNRDPNFIGREDVIDQIDVMFILRRRQRVAISGMAGVGKSQIAIEYCYKVKDRQPQTNVFWVHAGSKESFAGAYKGLAEHLGVPGLDNPKVDVLHLVAERLRDQSHSRWVIVLDGADDHDRFFGDGFFSRYIPESPACSVLVTTTDECIGRRLTRAEPIRVRCPNAQEAARLLRAKLTAREEEDKDDESEALTVTTLLNKLPLAITQAAAYINDNGISLGRFIKILRTSPANQHYLLKYGGSSSVMLTFQLCFDRVAKNTRAEELLSLMAVLESQEIPKSLLRKEEEFEAEFINALGRLTSMSLITAEND